MLSLTNNYFVLKQSSSTLAPSPVMILNVGRPVKTQGAALNLVGLSTMNFCSAYVLREYMSQPSSSEIKLKLLSETIYVTLEL